VTESHSPGHAVLLVPVPELEDYVVARTRHYDASFLSADPSFVHAHVTVLAPFVPTASVEELDAVAAIADRTPAFDFELAEVAAFPDGTIHLPPAPDRPFRELTAAVARAFPACPPYGGRYPDPVPHLTLDRVAPGISVAAVAADLRTVLPVRCRADRIELHWYANHDCRVLAAWKFGGPPAARAGEKA